MTAPLSSLVLSLKRTPTATGEIYLGPFGELGRTCRCVDVNTDGHMPHGLSEKCSTR